MSPHDGGTRLEWGVEGRGMRALSQILSGESVSYSLKHISMGEHSFHIHGGALISYIYMSCFMMTSSNGNMFCVIGFCAGNSLVTAGNSPVTGEFPSYRPVTRSFDVFFALRLNKWLSKQSIRRWFETLSRSLWRHCNVVTNSDPVIQAAVGSFGVQRVTLVHFRIGETGKIEGFCALWKEWSRIWHTVLSWLPFLEINYILHSAAI